MSISCVSRCRNIDGETEGPWKKECRKHTKDDGGQAEMQKEILLNYMSCDRPAINRQKKMQQVTSELFFQYRLEHIFFKNKHPLYKSWAPINEARKRDMNNKNTERDENISKGQWGDKAASGTNLHIVPNIKEAPQSCWSPKADDQQHPLFIRATSRRTVLLILPVFLDRIRNLPVSLLVFLGNY